MTMRASKKHLKACRLDHGGWSNSANVYGHHGLNRTCIRVFGTDAWYYDPRWEIARDPRFLHDCTNGCTYLGSWRDYISPEESTQPTVREYDLYVHVSDLETTLLARYGDFGPDYYSGREGLNRDNIPSSRALTEAGRRAAERGIAWEPDREEF